MKNLYFFLIAAFASLSLSAQIKEPVKWEFSSVKKSDKVYEITLTAMVEKPWHIYSQNTPAGGPLPTKITYTNNPLLTVSGRPKETGKLLVKHEEIFGVDVKYFDSKVQFVQTINLKTSAKTSISGKIEFMICDDTQCLPPKKVPFEIKLN